MRGVWRVGGGVDQAGRHPGVVLVLRALPRKVEVLMRSK